MLSKPLAAGAALLAGGIMPFAHAPWGWWPLAFISIAGLFWLIQGRSVRAAAGLAWLYGLSMFGGGIYWIYISTHIFGGAPIWLGIALAALLVAYVAVFPALAAGSFARLSAGLNNRPGSMAALLFAACWAVAEWLRGWFLTGFPWFSVGYSQTDSILSAWAPIWGVYGVGFILVLLSVLAVVVLRQTAQGTQALAAVLALVVLLIASWGLQTVSWSQPTGKTIDVAIVQGNIPQDQKWLAEMRLPTLERYRSLSSEHWDTADLLLWPEVAIPAVYSEVETAFLAPLRDELVARDAVLVSGVLTESSDGRNIRNSLVRLGPGDTEFYHKRHLVPFGEFFPVPQFIRDWMREQGMPFSDIERGQPQQAPLLWDDQVIAASICFEDVFGEEIMRDLPAGNLLLNVSNDAWFGDSTAPHQHQQIARMRALEGSRWMIRATNTGMSAIINHHGKILGLYPQFETGVLTGAVEFREGATPYMVWRNYAVMLLSGLIICFYWFRRRRAYS